MRFFRAFSPRFFVTSAILLTVLSIMLGTIWWRQRELPSIEDQRAVATQLAQVRVISERPTIIGYKRKKFGGWAGTDDCTTRTKVLVDWFGGTPCKPDSRTKIADPYSGETISSAEVDIDHIFPLAAAWDFGAATWSTADRHAFANDHAINLVPTRSDINREKSDLTPAEWMPSPAQSCGYAHRYLSVAISWQLAISYADWAALADACAIDTG